MGWLWSGGSIIRWVNGDRWLDHFRLNVETGYIEPLTSIARATAQLLQINRPESVMERALLLKGGAAQNGLPFC